MGADEPPDPGSSVHLPVLEVRLPGIVLLVVEVDGGWAVVELAGGGAQERVVAVEGDLEAALARVIELADPLTGAVASETVDLAHADAGGLEPVVLVDGGTGFVLVLKQASDLYLVVWADDDGTLRLLDGHPSFADAVVHAVSV